MRLSLYAVSYTQARVLQGSTYLGVDRCYIASQLNREKTLARFLEENPKTKQVDMQRVGSVSIDLKKVSIHPESVPSNDIKLYLARR